jgi:hypothetical protein
LDARRKVKCHQAEAGDDNRDGDNLVSWNDLLRAWKHTNTENYNDDELSERILSMVADTGDEARARR